jgi:DNA-binding CsgD family transcriptional regulator
MIIPVGVDHTSGPRTSVRGPGSRADEAARIALPGPSKLPYSQGMRVLERDRELEVLARAFVGAAGGSGSGITIAGEPGAGKSTLVAAACERATGMRIVRGGCDPLTTPRPLGPFRDAFARLSVGEQGSAALQGTAIEVCEAVYDALRSEPTVLVVEDIHWIDSASVEVMRFLVRRLDAMPCALVVTYRDDEIDVRHVARPLLGDVAALGHVATRKLEPLSPDGVAAMLADGPLEAERVYRLTGGNPFFVAEVAKEPDRPLPATVRDAVLARLHAISPQDFEVLQLAAAAPDRIDDRLLPALGVDLPTLRRLHDTGLLERDRHGLVFRHELSRLAVESTIPAGGIARLHGRLLDALERIEPRDPAVLTHHAVAAGERARANRYAREAADEAVVAGSHSEAASFLLIALDNLVGGEPAERARLQVQLGYEQYMTSHLETAIASIEESFPLWHTADDIEGLAAAHESCAVFEYYNADRRQAQHHADRAADLASAAPGVEYGSARVTQAYLAYLASEYDVTELGIDDGARVAEQVGSEALTLRGSLVRALSDLSLGRPGSRERSLVLIERAREAHLDELASTGYSNVSYLDVEQVRLSAGESVLEVSLPFTVERDIPVCNHWQTAVRSRLRFREGRWTAALEDADKALRRGGMPLARFWPLIVGGLVTLRRDGTPDGQLDAAWDLAISLGEPMRIVPALAALAEQAWLTGTPDERVTTSPVRVAGWLSIPALAWSLGDLAVWLRRLEIECGIDADLLAEPHRLTLAGSHEAASSWWDGAGAVYEAAMARADGDAVEATFAGLERLDLLGAVATADRLRRDLRRRGVAQVPARPRAATRANPSGLTNRQLEVAKLVARGFTNAEIAARLFISLRTTDHHVSAVLTKLGLPSRRAIVVQAAQLGLG